MKYVTGATTKAYWDSGIGDEIHMPHSVDVFETDSDPRATGVYDAAGRQLYRLPDRVRIGYQAK